MPRSPLYATRRSTVAGAFAGALVTGCSVDSSEPGAAPSTSGASAGNDPTSAPVDADAAVVDDVVAALSAAHALVKRTRRDHPDLRDRLAPFQQLHEEHASLLGDLRRPRPSGDDASSRRALREVAATEQRLQQTLGSAAVDVASGDLAATLASMAAAVAQQVAAS